MSKVRLLSIVGLLILVISGGSPGAGSTPAVAADDATTATAAALPSTPVLGAQEIRADLAAIERLGDQPTASPAQLSEYPEIIAAYQRSHPGMSAPAAEAAWRGTASLARVRLLLLSEYPALYGGDSFDAVTGVVTVRMVHGSDTVATQLANGLGVVVQVVPAEHAVQELATMQCQVQQRLAQAGLVAGVGIDLESGQVVVSADRDALAKVSQLLTGLDEAVRIAPSEPAHLDICTPTGPACVAPGPVSDQHYSGSPSQR